MDIVPFLPFPAAFTTFCLLDTAMTKMNLQGIYYAVHTLHNIGIVYLTAPDVIDTVTHFSSIATAPVNYNAIQLCFALHLYHCAYYWRKFQTDDWLHHGLMIGLALPVGSVLPAGTLMGYSLFFTTGLPGGIDYAMLFLTRNNWLDRQYEKRLNMFLNVWVRSPGCASHAVLTVAYLYGLTQVSYGFWLGALLTAFLNYWNGQYYMQRVVFDAGEKKLHTS